MLYTAFIIGLLSSLHCIGMCGPIAMMLPLDRSNQAKMTIQLILYHLGRISAYASLGLIFGLLGRGFYLAGLQQQLSIAAGIIMIAIVLFPEKKLARYNFSASVLRILAQVKTVLGNHLHKRSYKSFYITGLMNGFLPCGLVYAALFGALAMQDAALGVIYMALYGLGTLPMMSLVVYTAGMMTKPFRSAVYRFVPYITAFIGVLFILRGLGLGIPFLSPGGNHLFIQAKPDCGVVINQ